MSEQVKKSGTQNGVRAGCHESAGTGWNRFLGFYARRFEVICPAVVGAYGVLYLTLVAPQINGDLRSPGVILFQFCLMVAGPGGGWALFYWLKRFHQWASKRTGHYFGRPFLVASTDVPKPRMVDALAGLGAGFNGLFLNSKRHRELMRQALHSPYLYTLGFYDEFEDRFDRGDWAGAFEALLRVFDPAVLPFARSIIYEAYGDALGDSLLLNEVKSWFRRPSPGVQLRMAVVCFILEDYRTCVTKFQRICRSTDCDPAARKAYVKMMDLVLSVAAVNDPGWQRIRADFLRDFPDFATDRPASILPP